MPSVQRQKPCLLSVVRAYVSPIFVVVFHDFNNCMRMRSHQRPQACEKPPISTQTEEGKSTQSALCNNGRPQARQQPHGKFSSQTWPADNVWLCIRVAALEAGWFYKSTKKTQVLECKSLMLGTGSCLVAVADDRQLIAICSSSAIPPSTQQNDMRQHDFLFLFNNRQNGHMFCSITTTCNQVWFFKGSTFGTPTSRRQASSAQTGSNVKQVWSWCPVHVDADVFAEIARFNISCCQRLQPHLFCQPLELTLWQKSRRSERNLRWKPSK